MTSSHREIAASRRNAPAEVKSMLDPLEQCAHDTAMRSASFAALLLKVHGDAALPLTEGTDAIRLASEAAQHALASWTKIGEAHAQLRAIGIEHFRMSGPECPEDFAWLGGTLRSVA